MRLSFSVKGFLALAAILVFSGVSMAQSIVTGAVSGTVTDPSGAVIVGANVTLTNPSTGQTKTITTNSAGIYEFPLLTPGAYSVSVQHDGFAKAAQNVTIVPGQVSTADFKLQLGASTSEVEVTAAAPLLQTNDANLTTTLNSKEISEIPNPGNDITYTAQTLPGVIMNNSTLGGYGNFTVFGLPADSNLFTINGLDYNDPFLNLNNSGSSNLLLGNNEMQDVTVVVNGYTGENGRQAGAMVNYTTMSGTNEFHGDALYDWTGRYLNANDPLAKFGGSPRPFENNNQWAARLGGPIIKNKLFFFANTEGIRYIFGSTANVFVPTPAFQTYVMGNIPKDANTQAFYANIFKLYNAAPGISKAKPDPAGNADCSSLTTFTTGPCLETWSNSLSNGNKEWLLSGRVDYDRDANNTIFGHFKLDRGTQPTYTDPINSIFNNQSVQPQDDGQLNFTHVFSPYATNQFIGSVLWYSAVFGSLNAGQALGQFPGNLWVDDTSMTALGTGSGNPNGFVAGFLFPQGRNVTQWQMVDDLSIVRGSHAFKMGANFRRDDVTDYTASELNQYPVVLVSMAGFANDQLDAAGAPPGLVQRNFSINQRQPLAVYSLGAYFQDIYSVSSKLKLTMTLRADRNSGGVCQSRCASVGIAPFADMPHGASVPYDSSFIPGQSRIIPSVEKVVFEPRGGFAWNVQQNTVVRGGVGLFTDLYPGEVIHDFTTNFPEENVWGISPATATLAWDMASPGSTKFPTSPVSIVQTCNAAFNSNFFSGGSLTTYNATAPAACIGSVPNYDDPPSKLLNPKYVEWDLEIQHSLNANTAVSVKYVGNRGYNETVYDPYSNAWCDPKVCAGIFGGNPGLPAAAPDPRVASVISLTNSGYSNFNGLTLAINETGFHGLSGWVGYTYSHSLDTASNGGINPFSVITSASPQANPFNPSAGYGPSDYDARQAINASYIYEIPFKSSNRMIDGALGGWELAGTWFWHSAFPFTVLDAASINAMNGAGDNVGSSNVALGQIYLQPAFSQRDFPNGQACVVAACFGPATSLKFAPLTNFTGKVGRNAFRGPGFLGGDMTLRKTFDLNERMQFQLGFNMFNVLNHANYGDPWPSTAALPMGQTFFMSTPPTSPYGAFAAAATDMRMAQIQGKFMF